MGREEGPTASKFKKLCKKTIKHLQSGPKTKTLISFLYNAVL